ncbi:AAA family ATPase [Pseudobutyrivibrio xylanivorans]|uniref:Predicted ATP-binding protein involved in virulence n=1 Tax=Pseudobutyrivibrio xylanivorans DSM 14809 TaxID=1123012 RepID=A0A1M6JPM6_PSEXY|nr:AAA family ATPase [Pseudobutyrivibrio xylanivorans]SHJ48689.1 Predicted ATP-binding protein involved in virulence [Pseudobutyrivibrio xylanivorans DSM 14809]
MSDIFIKEIQIDEVRNLANISIPISGEQKKNLIITGKNGTGKTSLLNAISRNLSFLLENGDYTQIEHRIRAYEQQLSVAITNNNSENDISRWTNNVENEKRRLLDVKAGVLLRLNNPVNSLKSHFENNEFVVAYYRAKREFKSDIPNHIEKVNLKDRYTLNESPRIEFVKYIVDLKMKEALARTSGKNEVADTIHRWFMEFDNLLKAIFEDDSTALVFDEENFTFSIVQANKQPFGFNVLSDGYAAVLDIVVDIMMRMEKHTNRSFVFDMPGIVFIDEIETHLHIELQRNVMKLLTTFFPNIQFIVTTHSPFIINSVENAVVFDLETRTLAKDGLSNIPYEGIVEGYFGADLLSDELRNKFERYKDLIKKEVISDTDIEEIMNLETYLEEIPDYLGLDISTEYHRLKLEFHTRGDKL